ncbi:MAG: hypothetical protein COB58_00140 [Thalassobium sp.]|nr:MAG: hypothetical protein COB43_09165 [Oceanospirillales bacterium]PHQ88331.1 MAG: hypothetical protein COB58_00140 [Thalassobium sp.]
MNLNHVLFLIVSVLLIVIVGNFLTSAKKNIDPNVAIRKAVISFEEKQLDLLFDHMRAFADENSFAIGIAPTTPEDKNLISHMWREDIKLVMVNPFEEEKYRIYFYKNSANAVPEDILNLLVLELKSFLTDTPSVIVTERK